MYRNPKKTGKKGRLWTILNETNHGRPQDRKRGWVVHWSFQWTTRSKARLDRALAIPTGHEIRSEAGSCIGHSNGSRDRKRCSCLFKSIPYLELWLFFSPNPDQKRGFFFRPVNEICDRYSLLFSLLRLEFEKRSGIQQYWYAHGYVSSLAFVTAQHFRRLQCRPTLQSRFRFQFRC